jgi:signal transduction histidine kinase
MKLLLLRRLSTRLAFKQTVTFALLVVIIAWSAYALLARRIYGQVDEELQDRAIAVRSMLQIRAGNVKWLNAEADPEVRAQFERSMRYYELLDEEGHTLDVSRAMSALHLPASPALPLSVPDRTTYQSVVAGDSRIRILDVPVLGPAGRHYLLRIGGSLDEADDDCRRLQLVLLALVPFIILAHAANAWIMASYSLRPLEITCTAAKQITPFDLAKRLPVSGRGDELDELNVSLNTMVSRLQSSFQRMTEFLRNLSHEIRQPLTVLRAETEQALRLGTTNETNYRDMLSKQLEHVELLARTVSDLMELAQSEGEQIKLQKEREDLSELVQAAIDGMRSQALDRGIQISGTVQQHVIGAFDAGQIWRLLLNLLDNSIKFNHATGHIDVILAVHNDQAIISVTDTGSGIITEDQVHIFERGYRAPSARKSNVPGTGLGLHFAQGIAEAHGGRIEVTSMPGEGSCFRVSLPLLTSSTTGDGLISAVHPDTPIN